MTTTPEGQAPGPSAADLYAEANHLNAKLAISTDSALIATGRKVAQALLEQVAAKLTDFEDFKRRVAISEEFSLTEARQVPKVERELKVQYLRATSLLEAAGEAEERARKKSSRK
jgi:hypothetical protein